MAIIKSQQSKITTCLWFDKNAEEAVKFYTSVFKRSKKGRVNYYPEGAPMPEGTVMTVGFQIEGQEFVALNGGPYFKFDEAISFIVNCKTQREIDYYWEKLSKGGVKSQCGWLKDKFGLSWQIAPTVFFEMMLDKDAKRASRAMQAVLKMKKLDLKKIEQAYRGKGKK
jgi:predicted 3-demethylubiquinone-9 3-methyltransferase (glyoxalase superfamily)